jgi:hypothetical protein
LLPVNVLRDGKCDSQDFSGAGAGAGVSGSGGGAISAAALGAAFSSTGAEDFSPVNAFREGSAGAVGLLSVTGAFAGASDFAGGSGGTIGFATSGFTASSFAAGGGVTGLGASGFGDT